jgi:5-dehydro-4-deoxyglucarate dehydratase
MKPDELRGKLLGVISFPVTPFKPDFSLDLDALRFNLRSLLQHPICAIVPAAGTGELFSLTPAEHLAVLKATLEEVNGKVPVLAAAGFNHPLALELAKQSAAAGANGILAFPPYYPNADPDGLFEYYQAIGRATPLGLIIYSRDWANFSSANVEKLTLIPNLIAWKDGQGDVRRYQMIMARVGDRLHWIGGAGDDCVPGYYSIGVRTYTSSIANVAPKLSLRLHELASNGHSAELDTLMRELVVPMYALRARRKGYEVSVMKKMMDLIGLKGGVSRPPLVEVTAEEEREIAGWLPKWRAWL